MTKQDGIKTAGQPGLGMLVPPLHGATYQKSPEGTRILGAMKISGKTRSG